MKRLFGSILISLFVAQSFAQSKAQPVSVTCKETRAPVSGAFIARGKNRGISPPGFVNLADSTATVHGVDVSKYQQDVDPFAVKKCGGEFMYVRISEGLLGFNELAYPATWGQARAAKLMVGPYHHLSFLPASIESGQIAVGASNAMVVKQFEAAGHAQAVLFSKRYEQLRADDRIRDKHALFLPPMVAVVEQTRLPKWLGRLRPEWYQATLCAFVKDVESEPWINGQKMIIFTQAGIFDEMKLSAASCLQGGKRVYWLQYPTPDGGGLPLTSSGPASRLIADLCSPPDQSRQCLFHQYTNRGGAVMGSLDVGLNLDRFFGSSEQLSSLAQKGGIP
jgi:hypothetical protein